VTRLGLTGALPSVIATVTPNLVEALLTPKACDTEGFTLTSRPNTKATPTPAVPNHFECATVPDAPVRLWPAPLSAKDPVGTTPSAAELLAETPACTPNIVLNSSIARSAGSPQDDWLIADPTPTMWPTAGSARPAAIATAVWSSLNGGALGVEIRAKAAPSGCPPSSTRGSQRPDVIDFLRRTAEGAHVWIAAT